MDHVGQELKRGFFYTFITKYTYLIVRLVISAILARLLTPADFGVFAIVLVFIGFTTVITELGIKPAIVHEDSLTQEENSFLFLSTVILGLAVGLIVYFVFYVVFLLYENTFYLDFRIFGSLLAFIVVVKIVPMALLRKQLQFKFMGLTTVAANVAGGVLGIVLAYTGWGIYALVFQKLITDVLTFVVFFLRIKLPIRLLVRMNALEKIKSFALNQLGYNILNYFARNTDKFIIGKFLGDVSLGIYDRANRLMKYPVDYLTMVFTPVLFPVLTRIKEQKERVREIYLKLLKVLALISFPMVVVLNIFAREIILLMFGDQWHASIPIFQVLCILSGFHVLYTTTGSIFQAFGRTDKMLFAGIISHTLLVVGVLVGLRWGLMGVTYGYFAAYLIGLVPVFVILFRLFEGTFRDVWRTLKEAVAISLIIGVILKVLLQLVSFESLIVNLAVFTAVSVALYLLLLHIFRLDRYLWGMFRGKRAKEDMRTTD